MDWERRKYTWEIRGQTRTERGQFAQCVSLVSTKSETTGVTIKRGYWKSRERKMGREWGTRICTKSGQDEMIGRRDLDVPRDDSALITAILFMHELRSTTMDFKFHLPTVSMVLWHSNLESVSEGVHTPTLTIVITPHSLAPWCLLMQALQILDRYPQWSLHLYCERFMHVKICDTWLQGLL